VGESPLDPKSIIKSSIKIQDVTQRDFSTDILFNSDIDAPYFEFITFPAFDGIPDFLLKDERIRRRRIISDFRNSVSTKRIAKILSDYIKISFQDLDKILFCIIPAGGLNKSEKRFRNFCHNVSMLTGMINGYEVITNKESENGDEGTKSFKIEGDVHYQDIFVFDDSIQTSGTFSAVCKELYSNGVRSVTRFFLGDGLIQSKA
jgi:hypothetical protein